MPSNFRTVALGAMLLIAHLGSLPDGRAQQPGEQDYMTLCAPCHTIGADRLIGPDLIDVHVRHSEQWLLEFVQSSQSMIERGDADAVAIFEEFSRLPMPDPPLSENQIRDVLAYIRTASAAVAAGSPPIVLGAIPDGETAAQQPTVSVETPTEDTPPVDATEPLPMPPEAEILRGQGFFQGHARFENGGPTCNSCHDIVSKAVIGGGSLSVDLTNAFSRLGGPGVQAILSASPFPVMQAAYEDRALTQDEVTALVSFLQQADQQGDSQASESYGWRLLISGLIGTVFLFGLFSILWRGRKAGSVNQTIFDRQIESSWED